MTDEGRQDGESAEATADDHGGRTHWTSGAHAIASIGPQCERLVIRHLGTDGSLYIGDDVAITFAAALKNSFTDEGAAAILEETLKRLTTEPQLVDLPQLNIWLAAHAQHPADVMECLKVVPPDGFRVTRLLSQAGNHKTVFLADWTLHQKEVVLKRVNTGDATRDREAEALYQNHRNILQTHKTENAQGEIFLYEDRVFPLTDETRSDGLEDAVNLIHDIASALVFVHDRRKVHADVKPDNIARYQGRFVLLDFGVCQTFDEFSSRPNPTGTIRTRAPELLSGEEIANPAAIDVWALGATLFNVATGRFPLFETNEILPRKSDDVGRKALETTLRQRVAESFDDHVTLADVPHELRELLAMCLQRSPEARPTASNIVQYCEKQLAAHVQDSEGSSLLSPSIQLQQLIANFDTRAVALMPPERRAALARRLGELGSLVTDDELSDRTDRLKTATEEHRA